MPPLVAAAALVTLGLVIAGVRRAPPPPLTIARRADSPLTDSSTQAALRKSGELQTTNAAALVEEQIYICGARTKKGTPCSRRVHGPVRCWQHKGMPAMMAQEKLLIKE